MRYIQAICLALLLAACARSPETSGFEMAEADTGSDVIVLVEGPDVEAPPKRRGLFAMFDRDVQEPPEDTDVIAEVLIADGATAVDPEAEGPSMTDEEIAAMGLTADGLPQASTRPRLFGFLRQRVPGEATSVPTPTERMLAEQGDVPRQVSMTDEEIAARGPTDETVSTRPRFSLFGNRVPGDVGGAEVSANAPPSRFGTITKACGVPKRDMGTEVARSPGNGAYTLYDTAPESAGPRVQYVTGFKDGCPRQFLAALAIFGSPVVHETKRYDTSNSTGYSEADNAYERAKRQVCGVGRGKTCPEGRLNRLGREVALLTAYPSFGGTSEWLDVVLYKGDVAGSAVESF
ncbi:MAG: hypothetical protein AAGP08_05425 [Pseudomonadota bacterium]